MNILYSQLIESKQWKPNTAVEEKFVHGGCVAFAFAYMDVFPNTVRPVIASNEAGFLHLVCIPLNQFKRGPCVDVRGWFSSTTNAFEFLHYGGGIGEVDVVTTDRESVAEQCKNIDSGIECMPEDYKTAFKLISAHKEYYVMPENIK